MAWLVLVLVLLLVAAGIVGAMRLRTRIAGDPISTIDPLSLDEPWRRFVGDAMQAKRRYDQIIRGGRQGPLHDRLMDIGQRVNQGVIECWRAARSGQALSDARKHVDSIQTQRRLETITKDAADEATAQTVDALRAQLESAARLDTTIEATRDQLRLLDARMDEAVTRAAELSVSSDTEAIETLSNDVDGIVGDLEALRQGLEAT